MKLANIEITDLMNGTFAIVESGENLAFTDSREDADRIKRALERESLKFLVFAARDEQVDCIESTLGDAAWRLSGEVGSVAQRTDMLVAVLDDWQKRVKLEENAKLAAHGQQVQHDQQDKPRRTDNGDGTVTFHGVPVTVRADVLGGRDVLAVRPPRIDEMFVETDCTCITLAARTWGAAYRVIVGPKTQPPVPAFREGGFYRDRSGRLKGPLKQCDDDPYVWQCDGWTYTATGLRFSSKESPDDLMSGEVIVWRHPGLKSGEYRWNGRKLSFDGECFVVDTNLPNPWADWIDPPRAGKWLVSTGQEYATWEGE